MKKKLVVRSGNVLKRNALRFAAALLVALATLSSVRTQLWLKHRSITIRCRASTERKSATSK